MMLVRKGSRITNSNRQEETIIIDSTVLSRDQQQRIAELVMIFGIHSLERKKTLQNLS